MYNLKTKICQNKKLLNKNFDQKFGNYNFIVEKTFKFKILLQLVCTNAYL